jgi:hypothetical protein
LAYIVIYRTHRKIWVARVVLRKNNGQSASGKSDSVFPHVLPTR